MSIFSSVFDIILAVIIVMGVLALSAIGTLYLMDRIIIEDEAGKEGSLEMEVNNDVDARKA